MDKERYWHEIKVVKSKKNHKCECCEEIIPKGSRVLVETGRFKTEGFFSYYFHTEDTKMESGNTYGCHDEFIDVCFVNKPEAELIKDKTFFGQVSYEHWKERNS